jgi:hypothetical protein
VCQLIYRPTCKCSSFYFYFFAFILFNSFQFLKTVLKILQNDFSFVELCTTLLSNVALIESIFNFYIFKTQNDSQNFAEPIPMLGLFLGIYTNYLSFLKYLYISLFKYIRLFDTNIFKN